MGIWDIHDYIICYKGNSEVRVWARQLAVCIETLCTWQEVSASPSMRNKGTRDGESSCSLIKESVRIVRQSARGMRVLGCACTVNTSLPYRLLSSLSSKRKKPVHAHYSSMKSWFSRRQQAKLEEKDALGSFYLHIPALFLLRSSSTCQRPSRFSPEARLFP